MKILICDDDVLALNLLKEHVQKYMNHHQITCNITALDSPLPILEGDLYYDLAFLDIQMDGINGIALAQTLKSHNSKIALFFVTDYNFYQDDAMDLRAFRFFSKPIDLKRLYSGLDKAMEYIDGAYVDVFLQKDNTQEKILVDDILYITRLNRKVYVKTNTEILTVHDDYNDLCRKLPNRFFYAVHRSFYINLHYVVRYQYSEIFMSDHTRIPVASRKQADFHCYWFEYMRRR